MTLSKIQIKRQTVKTLLFSIFIIQIALTQFGPEEVALIAVVWHEHCTGERKEASGSHSQIIQWQRFL